MQDAGPVPARSVCLRACLCVHECLHKCVSAYGTLWMRAFQVPNSPTSGFGISQLLHPRNFLFLERISSSTGFPKCMGPGWAADWCPCVHRSVWVDVCVFVYACVSVCAHICVGECVFVYAYVWV